VLLDLLRKEFATGKTKELEWRQDQLRQLLRALHEMKKEMTDALQADLGKAPFISELTSI